MRLLYVCSDWGIRPDGTKGASIHLRAITLALARRGHEVMLLSPRGGPGGGHPAKALIDMPCELAEETSKLLRGWIAKRDLASGIEREIRPLVYNAWASEAAIRALDSHPPDAVIERLSLFGHLGVDIADAFRVPLLLEANAPLTREASTFRSLQLSSLAAEIEARVMRRADVIAPVSKELADLLIAQGVARDRIEVVPNGVDPALFADLRPRAAIRDELGLGHGFVVGFAGSLKPWHGVGILLEAFSVLARSDDSATLLIVGAGPMLEQLREDARRKNLTGRITFTGAVPHDQVPSYLAAMDIAVAPFLPSEDFYFSPIKVFEYMAAGVCVVASRIGQLADVIADGADGLLFEPGDVDGLLQTVELARRSPSLRSALSERALSKVMHSFTWDRAAKQVEQRLVPLCGSREVETGAGARRPVAAA